VGLTCNHGGLELCTFVFWEDWKLAFLVKTGILSQIPLGDFGDPIDIAEAVAFLACERSKYITGASFDVNGGMA